MSNGAKALSEDAIRSIHHCKIHPGIGIARVGNSPDSWFIGPEVPNYETVPEGGYKDAAGRVRRQAARFRVYAYDADDEPIGELTAEAGVAIAWSVHLANKKGAWYNFVSRFRFNDAHRIPDNFRNRNVERFKKDEAGNDDPANTITDPNDRLRLIIDPGAREIGGVRDHPPESMVERFGGGHFGFDDVPRRVRRVEVPLGELRMDKAGRLIVLGGFGKSGSIKWDTPTTHYANNDWWYDDTSDGPVRAKVTLPGGREIEAEGAWVIVAPPDFAPGIQSIVTLYDVIRDTAVRGNWLKDDRKVVYYRDIYPILARIAATTWVNGTARRGHGKGKKAEFKASGIPNSKRPDPFLLVDPILSDPQARTPTETGAAPLEARSQIFGRLRIPPELASDAEAADRANDAFMPPLSGDAGGARKGRASTWMTVLASQYRRFKKWADGDFETGQRCPPARPLNELTVREQIDALQRAALEPCVGGAFFPGIEMTFLAADPHIFSGPFRIDAGKLGAGDITKYMAVPWQADFYECQLNWWPAQRPDDVVPEEVYAAINEAWSAGDDPISELLEDCVPWERGLAVSNLYRRPWRNPAGFPEEVPDDGLASTDPGDPTESAGREDMVRYWHELGFVTPVKARSGEFVHVEKERRPFAGMDVRTLFHALQNVEEQSGCRPKVREYVENVLAAARDLQAGPGTFTSIDNIKPFRYSEAAFLARMNDIYDDIFELAEKYDPGQDANFSSREDVIERIRQFTPFNLMDGSWLRNVHRMGPVDEVNSLLFSILMEELGEGVESQNHANVWRDLCHSVNFYPPPVNTSAFANDPRLLNAAFESAAFQLAISEFNDSYYPEILGMTLYLEWGVQFLRRVAVLLEHHGIDSRFYRLHIAIDNAASGHGYRIVRAVSIYLARVHETGGDDAVQYYWRRIWDGYVAFGYTLAILIEQIKHRLRRRELQQDRSRERNLKELKLIEERLKALILQKRPYGELNHGTKMIGSRKINDCFSRPSEFLQALKTEMAEVVVKGRKIRRPKWIVPGDPDASPFFKLLEFDGGRMYRVFREEEITLWRAWVRVLGLPLPLQPVERAAAFAAAARPAEGSGLDNRILGSTRFRRWAQSRGVQLPGRSEAAADDQGFGLMTAQAATGAVEADLVSAAAALERESIAWAMGRVIAGVAAEYASSFSLDPFRLRAGSGEPERPVTAWMSDILASPNPTQQITRFLDALVRTPGLVSKGRPSDSVFMTKWLAAGSDLGRLLRRPIAANDGQTGRETAELWIRLDAPLPPSDAPDRKLKPLPLEATPEEDITHPTGTSFGLWTVH